MRLKKIKSFLLAIATVFVSSSPLVLTTVDASDTMPTKAVVVIHDTTKGREYTGYPVLNFKGETSDGKVFYWYDDRSSFKDFLSNYSGFDKTYNSSEGVTYVEQNDSYSDKQFIKDLKNYINSTDTSSFFQQSATSTADGSDVTLTFDFDYDAKNQYVYVNTETGALVGIKNTKNVTDETGAPLYKAEIYDKTKGMEITKIADKETADVGNIVEYTTKIDLPKKATVESFNDPYNPYKYQVADLMTGLTYNNDLKISLESNGGTKVTKISTDENNDLSKGITKQTYNNPKFTADGSDQPLAKSINVVDCEVDDGHGNVSSNGNGFTLEFEKLKGVDPDVTKMTDCKLVLTYSGTVTSEAVEDIKASDKDQKWGSDNTVFKYSNTADPDPDPESIVQINRESTTYVTGFKILKADSAYFDKDGNLTDAQGVLKGAEFVLKRESDNKYFHRENDTVTWTDDLKQATVAATDAHGLSEFAGFGVGKYQLIETKAPEGYNKLRKPIELDIYVAENKYGRYLADRNDTSVHKDSYPAYYHIANSSGIELPEAGSTAGMIATVIGCIAGATVIIFLATGRKNNNKQGR